MIVVMRCTLNTDFEMDKVRDMLVADVIIGIDPGASGGIAVWRPNAVPVTVKIPKSINEIVKYLEYWKEVGNVLVFLEKVQMFRSDDQGKQFRINAMLAGYERLKNALEVAGIPFVPVHPMSWQSYLKLRKKGEFKKVRKERYKSVAQEWFPEVKVTLWNCDALLLVAFGLKKKRDEPEWIQGLLPGDVYWKLL